VRKLDVSKRAGGVLHAKYFVVDGADSFVGSQNFDWRALAHIQEMGVRVRSKEIAGALLDVLDTDWDLAAGAANDARVHRHGPGSGVHATTGEDLTFVASPKGWLPAESTWDLPRLVAMLDAAKESAVVQLLTYKTKDRDGGAFTTLDDALRRAAGRGVHVRLLLSEWAQKPGGDARNAADALARVPNVEVRFIVIPKFSGGDIPFARVAHAKYLVVDGGVAWVGTSNWEGDYFLKSRNVGVIATGGALPSRLRRYFDENWVSTYVTPLAP
jgi:phosphatidylserine/phosphatidylglycerophosphate/cardiolipin synthase-like enzyme